MAETYLYYKHKKLYIEQEKTFFGTGSIILSSGPGRILDKLKDHLEKGDEIIVSIKVKGK